MGSRRSGASAAPDTGIKRLETALVELMLEVDASIGAVFLLPPGERVLRMALLCGISHQIAAPWERVPLDDANPVSDAARERRFLWLRGHEEIARRYPRLGLMLPYDYVLAVMPIADAAAAAGSLVLVWPIARSGELSSGERAAIGVFRRRAGRLLRRNARDGLYPERPRILPPPRLALSLPSAGGEAQAAVRFVERLPTGCCALDVDGRVVFANSAAIGLLGVGAGELLGARPWEVLSWLGGHALFEDHYRAAVVSRQSSTFTAVRPPGIQLTFHLHPDSSGISVLMVPAGSEASADAEASADGEGPRRRRPPVGPELTGVSRIYQLMHLAAALAEAAGLSDVVDIAADQIVPAFGPSGMALLTVEEGRFQVIGHRGRITELVDRLDGASLASHVPAAHTVASGEPGFFSSFAELKRAYPAAIYVEGTEARAFLPLITSDRVIGALILTYAEARRHSRAERAVLTSLAGLIAQALDRARLYDTKHELAHALQSTLLPRTLPRLDGLDLAARYRPAGRGLDIGGDFYDVIRIDRTTAVATIGDVQGHHTTAAALMGQVRTGVHAHATIGAPPGAILSRTNRLLFDLDSGLFTSCLIVRLDLARRRAQFATAGHPPPLIRRPDGKAESLTLSPGLLLGIDPEADYPTEEIPLAPGTVLALYTDGMVEVPGADIEETTNDLARHLASATGRTMEEVADVLLANAPTAPRRYDDLALLLIRLVQNGPDAR